MEKLIPGELLEKYIDGKCTEAEIISVMKWYQSFDNDADYISDMTFTEERELEERIYNQILKDINSASEEKVIKKTGYFSRNWYSIAAAAIILFISFITLYRSQNSKATPFANAASTQMVSVTNNSGQIYKLTLPDKSTVWINPNSKITYPKLFGARSRNVSISGECFFEVTKNPQRPFIISSRSIITKVWGTSFLVNDNEKSNLAEVSVLTGKVSVSIKTKDKIDYPSLKPEKDEVMIYPHQKVTYLIDQHILKPQNVADEPALQIWNRINLSFDNKPLKDIIVVLNNKFHVHIMVGSEKLNHYILNADLSGFNLPDVLEALNKSLNVSYQIVNNNIILE